MYGPQNISRTAPAICDLRHASKFRLIQFRTRILIYRMRLCGVWPAAAHFFGRYRPNFCLPVHRSGFWNFGVMEHCPAYLSLQRLNPDRHVGACAGRYENAGWMNPPPLMGHFKDSPHSCRGCQGFWLQVNVHKHPAVDQGNHAPPL